jgi:DNA-binding GntR family transcriptional regulator
MPGAGRGQGAARAGELDRDESREPGELITAGKVPVPARVAAMLGVEPGAELASRRVLIRQDGGEASEILTWWLSPELARQTGLYKADQVRGGIRTLLARSAGVRVDHILEQVAARRPEPHEAKLLGISRTAPVLALYVTARDASGLPVVPWTWPCPVTCTSLRTGTQSPRFAGPARRWHPPGGSR